MPGAWLACSRLVSISGYIEFLGHQVAYSGVLLNAFQSIDGRWSVWELSG